MSTQLAQAERTHSAAPTIVALRAGDADLTYPERPLGVARGIVSAVLISAPFWALFAFALYLLI
jgi:hypothetical protein